MADVKKIATRDSYGNALTELAKEREDIIVLDADLAGATKTGIFKKAFPERHINCGIAESDMICVSAGLSTMGFVPFCSSFAMFAAGRAFEQVRNTVGYPHLNVKICATHGGNSVGEDGASPSPAWWSCLLLTTWRPGLPSGPLTSIRARCISASAVPPYLWSTIRITSPSRSVRRRYSGRETTWPSSPPV